MLSKQVHWTLKAEAEALEARVAELEKALQVAQDAMNERRSYAESWEWKYGAAWTEEDNIVLAALDPTFKP